MTDFLTSGTPQTPYTQRTPEKQPSVAKSKTEHPPVGHMQAAGETGGPGKSITKKENSDFHGLLSRIFSKKGKANPEVANLKIGLMRAAHPHLSLLQELPEGEELGKKINLLGPEEKKVLKEFATKLLGECEKERNATENGEKRKEIGNKEEKLTSFIFKITDAEVAAFQVAREQKKVTQQKSSEQGIFSRLLSLLPWKKRVTTKESLQASPPRAQENQKILQNLLNAIDTNTLNKDAWAVSKETDKLSLPQKKALLAHAEETFKAVHTEANKEGLEPNKRAELGSRLSSLNNFIRELTYTLQNS